jgi:hypothetical protein
MCMCQYLSLFVTFECRIQNDLTAEDAFCMGSPHSGWGSESALAGVKVR